MSRFIGKFDVDLSPASPRAGLNWRPQSRTAAAQTVIYEFVSGEESVTTRLATQVVWEIENCLQRQGWPTGYVIGSEAKLVKSFSVSREVVREAIRIGEAHGSLQMRRGRGGGLVACKPELKNASRAIAEYIFCSGATLAQLRQACEALDPLVVAQAAKNVFIAGERPDRSHSEVSDPVRRHLRFRGFVRDQVDDPVLALFWDMSTWLGLALADRDRIFDCDAAQTLSAYEVDMTDAILSGDAWRAEAICKRHVRDHWFFEMLSAQNANRSTITAHDGAGGFPGAGANRSAQIARVLMKDVRQRDCGDRLGSEWDICHTMSAGRPIVRQALRQLEDYGLLELRRGRAGGIFTCKQRPGSIMRVLYPYLAANGVQADHTLFFVWRMNIANVRLAARRAARFSTRERDHQRGKLRETVDAMPEPAKWVGVQEFISMIGENKVLDIMLRLVVGCSARTGPPLQVSRFAWDLHVRGASEVADAVLLGNVGRAEKLQVDAQTAMERLWGGRAAI